MIYGLLAAAGWGASAVAAAIAVRRASTFAIVLTSQAIGLIALVVLAFALPQRSGLVTGPVALGLAGAGLIGLIGYLTFYRAVALGPPGLMSAISSTYGGVAAGLAVGVLGERMSGLGVAGVLLAVAGVALAAARPAPAGVTSGTVSAGTVSSRARVAGTGAGIARSGTSGGAFPQAAVWFAGGSAIAYGVSGFLLADYSRRGGWLLSGIVAHGASVAAMLAVLPLLRGRTALRTGRSFLGWAAAAGLADAAGLLAYSRGAQLGHAAITAATSSVYPVIPLVVGVGLLGERLGRRQLAGIAVIMTGLVLLGLA